MLNTVLAAVLLAILVPVLLRFGDLALAEQVAGALVAVPVLLVALLCLASAARPGSLGRVARRARARRRR